MDNDSIGKMLTTVLYHMKGIDERVKWFKPFMKTKEKYILSKALNKFNSGINDLTTIVGDSTLSMRIKAELEKTDVIYFSMLTELLLPLKEETLLEITDMVESYLIQKDEKEKSASNHSG